MPFDSLMVMEQLAAQAAAWAVFAQVQEDAVSQALDTPAVRERLENLGATVVAAERRGPDYLGKFLRSEIAKWSGPIKASGAVLE